MPIRTTIWKVEVPTEPLTESSLETEQLLEEMIVSNPRLLSEDWMLVGRQEDTGFGGRIDLLAITPDGSLVLIELKRKRTPREVVAQALDYASWVEQLHAEDIAAIYNRFKEGRSLAQDFRQNFGENLDEETLNQNHQIIIVAASIDDSTERIVEYLSDRDIPINVLCFQVFNHGKEKLLSRVWLLDPVRTQVSAATTIVGLKEPWNGEFYCCFGHGESRSWADAVKYGFISAGGGARFKNALQLIGPGDRVWINVPRIGFVGVGIATGRAQSAAEFKVSTSTGDIPILEIAKDGSYHREFVNDFEKCEYFVPVHWLDTVPLVKAIKEIGFFGNQNIICRPVDSKWRSTVDYLKKKLPDYDCPIDAPTTNNPQ